MSKGPRSLHEQMAERARGARVHANASHSQVGPIRACTAWEGLAIEIALHRLLKAWEAEAADATGIAHLKRLLERVSSRNLWIEGSR